MLNAKVRDVAIKAGKQLKDAEIKNNYSVSALTGYFKGVANGEISTGADWPINLLLNCQTVIDPQTVEDLVASGIFSRGQAFSRSRNSLNSEQAIT